MKIKPKLVGRTKWNYCYACGKCKNAVYNYAESCNFCGAEIDWENVPKEIESEEQAKALGCETYPQVN